MGWLFGWQSKQDLVEHLKRSIHDFVDDKSVSVVGNNLWYAASYMGDEKVGPLKFIGLCLLNSSEGEWGYKSMDEHAGPFQTNCPVSLLKKCTLPLDRNGSISESAMNWREKVITNRLYKKFINDKVKELKPGDIITLYGKDYNFMRKNTRGAGSLVSREEEKGNKLYSITAAQMSEALNEKYPVSSMPGLDIELQRWQDIFEQNTKDFYAEKRFNSDDLFVLEPETRINRQR